MIRGGAWPLAFPLWLHHCVYDVYNFVARPTIED